MSSKLFKKKKEAKAKEEKTNRRKKKIIFFSFHHQPIFTALVLREILCWFLFFCLFEDFI